MQTEWRAMSKFSLILSTWGKQLLQPKFYVPGKPLDSQGSSFPVVTPAEESVRMNSSSEGCDLTSMFGLPVWADVVLKDNVANGRQLQLLWCLVNASQKKNIVKTVVQGRPGTVKEFISDGDWEITLEGGLFDENPTRYPAEDMNTLVYLLKLQEALPIVSEYVQMLGVHSIVADSFEFKQEKGTQNAQLFTVRFLSDEPIELVEE